MIVCDCQVFRYVWDCQVLSCVQVCMGLRDRTVQVYDTEKAQFSESHSFLGGEGIFKGLCCQDK